MEEKTSVVGRNEPCPCGSGKKYKRCCGVDAAPKLTAPKLNWGAGAEGGQPAEGAMPGFDPSQLDPQMMSQMASALQRLPRGQMQRLQALVQKAMAGKDVSREIEQFEKTLPPDLQTLIASFKVPGVAQAAAAMAQPETAPPAPQSEMSVDEARAVVEKALKEGKLSEEQAAELLEQSVEPGLSTSEESAEGSKRSKFWPFKKS